MYVRDIQAGQVYAHMHGYDPRSQYCGYNDHGPKIHSVVIESKEMVVEHPTDSCGRTQERRRTVITGKLIAIDPTDPRALDLELVEEEEPDKIRQIEVRASDCIGPWEREVQRTREMKSAGVIAQKASAYIAIMLGQAGQTLADEVGSTITTSGEGQERKINHAQAQINVPDVGYRGRYPGYMARFLHPLSTVGQDHYSITLNSNVKVHVEGSFREHENRFKGRVHVTRSAQSRVEGALDFSIDLDNILRAIMHTVPPVEPSVRTRKDGFFHAQDRERHNKWKKEYEAWQEEANPKLPKATYKQRLQTLYTALSLVREKAEAELGCELPVFDPKMPLADYEAPLDHAVENWAVMDEKEARYYNRTPFSGAYILDALKQGYSHFETPLYTYFGIERS